MRESFLVVCLLFICSSVRGETDLSQRLDCLLESRRGDECGVNPLEHKEKPLLSAKSFKEQKEFFYEGRASLISRFSPKVLKTSALFLGFDFKDPPWGAWTVESSFEWGKNESLEKESFSLGLLWRQAWSLKKYKFEVFAGPHYIWETWSLGERRKRSFLGGFLGGHFRYPLNTSWRVHLGARVRFPKQFLKHENGAMQNQKLRDFIYREDRTWAIYISLGINYLFD